MTKRSLLDRLFGKEDKSLGRTIHVSKTDAQGHVPRISGNELRRALSSGKTVIVHEDSPAEPSTTELPTEGSEWEWV